MKSMILLALCLLVPAAAGAQQPADVSATPAPTVLQPPPGWPEQDPSPEPAIKVEPAPSPTQPAQQPARSAYPRPPATPAVEEPVQRMGFADWMNELRAEAIAQGIRARTVYYALGRIYYPDPVIIEKDRTQPEKTMTAQRYWNRLLDDRRIDAGRAFYAANRELLRRVGEAYRVHPRYIAAILGVESNFGNHQGKENIINGLVTLAYDGRRAEYFRRELLNALRIIDRGDIRPENMRGSWAGAMGACQFMPSSYLKYAQDFDRDGRADIWGSIPDAAGSAANYLAQNGWRLGERWGREVQVTKPIPEEFIGTKVRKRVKDWARLGVRRKNGKRLPYASMMASLVQPDGPEGRSFLVYNNFHVLMRWNRSTYFAIAVGMLADKIGRR